METLTDTTPCYLCDDITSPATANDLCEQCQIESDAYHAFKDYE